MIALSFLAAAVGGYAARKKGRNWLFWGLLCFVFPPAVIASLLLPPVLSHGVTRQCPNCGRIIPQNSTVCSHCQSQLPIEMRKCPRCDSFVPEGETCPKCEGD